MSCATSELEKVTEESGKIINFTEWSLHKSVLLNMANDILLRQVYERTTKSQTSFVPADILQKGRGADALA